MTKSGKRPIRRRSFRVDLKGLVEVLSHHLYSSPTVFVRELLQNAVDAIEARRELTAKHRGKVRFEVDPPTRTIIVSDDGIGLTRDQISEFVARVGASSKRPSTAEDIDRYIGQFGIGILSCFMVADEVLILTRSVEPGSGPLEWRARTSGTYTVRDLESDLAVGTKVVLTLRPDSAEYAELPRLAGLLRKYGQYLEQEVTVEETGSPHSFERTSRSSCLWRARVARAARKGGYLNQEVGFEPVDVIPIRDAALGLEAVAYVLPEPAASHLEGAHRLYLKRMFVTDTDVRVTPRWASFVRCVINSNRLRPTASRESVCEDEVFRATRAAIGTHLSRYLHELAHSDQALLTRILSIHDGPMRQIACSDEDFFRAVIDLLTFETSQGLIRFGQFRAEHSAVRVARTVDQFRACAAIAAAQGSTIFNGGYTHHTELLERAVALDPTLSIESVDVDSLLEGFGDPAEGDASRLGKLMATAEQVLAPSNCGAVLRAFDPPDVPAVFAEGAERSLARSLDATITRARGFWREIANAVRQGITNSESGAFLCLNSRCDLIRAAAAIDGGPVLESVVHLLYVQALLLARQPVTEMETRAFAASLGTLIQAAARDRST